MSTRSRVGLELADGSILSIYSHYDGYPEWAGRILRTHYNICEKVEALVDGGDVSCLWTNERWSNDLLDRHREEYGPNYYSYRGEDCPPRLDENLSEYLRISTSEEYHYLFTKSGEWVCYDMHGDQPKIIEIPTGALMV